jgi:hypothetical protein
MYVSAIGQPAVRGDGGRWGSPHGRFRRGPTVLPPLHRAEVWAQVSQAATHGQQMRRRCTVDALCCPADGHVDAVCGHPT